MIKLYQNDVGLDSRLSTVEGTLNRVVGTVGSFGNAASKNVGVTVGTVADGGALTAETNRALAAEGANTNRDLGRGHPGQGGRGRAAGGDRRRHERLRGELHRAEPDQRQQLQAGSRTSPQRRR